MLLVRLFFVLLCQLFSPSTLIKSLFKSSRITSTAIVIELDILLLLSIYIYITETFKTPIIFHVSIFFFLLFKFDLYVLIFFPTHLLTSALLKIKNKSHSPPPQIHVTKPDTSLKPKNVSSLLRR